MGNRRFFRESRVPSQTRMVLPQSRSDDHRIDCEDSAEAWNVEEFAECGEYQWDEPWIGAVDIVDHDDDPFAGLG